MRYMHWKLHCPKCSKSILFMRCYRPTSRTCPFCGTRMELGVLQRLFVMISDFFKESQRKKLGRKLGRIFWDEALKYHSPAVRKKV
jgi:hypothetical protein